MAITKSEIVGKRIVLVFAIPLCLFLGIFMLVSGIIFRDLTVIYCSLFFIPFSIYWLFNLRKFFREHKKEIYDIEGDKECL